MSTKANIIIDQGTTFNTQISLSDDFGNPLDLSAYSANAQMRKWYTSLTSVAFTTTVSSGEISLAMTANQTAQLEPGRYVYDCIITDGNSVTTRVVEGIVTVNPRVTK